MPNRSPSVLRWLTLLVAVGLSGEALVRAHEVPTAVTVRMFVRPEGNRMRILVRVPLEAMRDMQVPVREEGYLDLERARGVVEDAAVLWVGDELQVYEQNALIGTPELVTARVSLPSDRSFGSYESALAHVLAEPLPSSTDVFWEQSLLDALFELPIEDETARFSIDPGLERLGVRVFYALRFVKPSGDVRAFDFPAGPGRVPLEPTWLQVAYRFVELGFFHILEGTDHLLFLLCLVIPFRRFRPLAAIVTSFTVAHSITLIAAALGYAPTALWFPPFVETVIALSILYMAFENIAGAKIERRWWLTFAFGLVHGFGFSFVLQQTLQFAGSHVATSLLAFNVGVELGQLLVLLLLIPALSLLFRFADERLASICLSALVAHTAWHWLTERAETLRQFGWPTFDSELVLFVLRFLTLLVLLAAAAWLWTVLRPTPDAGDTKRL